MKKATHAKRYSANLIGKVSGLAKPVEEYKFHAVRKWRLDFAWPEMKIALEVNGAIWTQGRHSRGSGLVKEYEKLNHAASDGWLVFQCTPQNVYSFTVLSLVKNAYDKRLKEYVKFCARVMCENSSHTKDESDK